MDAVDVLEAMGVDATNPSLIERLAATATAKRAVRVAIPSIKDIHKLTLRKNRVIRELRIRIELPQYVLDDALLELKDMYLASLSKANIEQDNLEIILALMRRGVLYELMEREEVEYIMGTNVFTLNDVEEALCRARRYAVWVEVASQQVSMPSTGNFSSGPCLAWLEDYISTTYERKYRMFMKELRATVRMYQDTLDWISFGGSDVFSSPDLIKGDSYLFLNQEEDAWDLLRCIFR